VGFLVPLTLDLVIEVNIPRARSAFYLELLGQDGMFDGVEERRCWMLNGGFAPGSGPGRLIPDL
jgi:hypothetical protein